MENNQIPNNETNTSVAPDANGVQPVQQQVQQSENVTQQTTPPVEQTVSNVVEQEQQVPEQKVEKKLSKKELKQQAKEAKKREKELKGSNYKNPEAFNSKEKVLFEAEEEKESNPLGTFIVFAVLIVGLFMLPFAHKLLGTKTQKKDYAQVHSAGTLPVTQSDLPDKYVFDSNQTSAGIGSLELKNFVKGESETGYEIHFTIINKAEESYLFTEKYYMDFYEGENLVYHALIHSYAGLQAKAAGEYTLKISERAYNHADSIRLVKTETHLYPSFELHDKEGDYSLLTCTYDKNTIVYYFKNEMLEKIRETYTNKNSTSDSYETDKYKHNELINKYKTIEGINANFVETPNEFTAQLDFELAKVQDSELSKLKTYRFFKYHEKANIIAYEMPAQGYICS